MSLTKYKLGELIELLNIRNSELRYGVDDVRGVNNLKQFMSTKADLSNRDLSKFQIVASGDFVFNHRTSPTVANLALPIMTHKKLLFAQKTMWFFVLNPNALHS